jgi:hypothetical protein
VILLQSIAGLAVRGKGEKNKLNFWMMDKGQWRNECARNLLHSNEA